MARAFAYLLALLYISTSVVAVPVEPRQLGGIGCNVARLKIVANLRQTTKAVNKLASSSDPAVADAAATAQGGLQDASDGIKTIAGALLSGQAPPADARDQVGQGLAAAQTALDDVASADDAAASEVADAQGKLEKTISAGQDVVAKCGGGDDAAADAGAADANADDGADAANADNGADVANADDGSDVANADDGSDAAAVDNSGADAADAATGDNVDAVVGNGRAQQQARPLRNNRIFGKRQIGGIKCNVARLQTVSRLAQSSAAVSKLKKAAAGDDAATAAAEQAASSLQTAKGAIGKIAAALVTGQQAPAAQRDITEQGLNDAMAALSSIDSTDSAVTSAVTNAQNKVSSTIQAGQGVVNNC